MSTLQFLINLLLGMIHLPPDRFQFLQIQELGKMQYWLLHKGLMYRCEEKHLPNGL